MDSPGKERKKPQKSPVEAASPEAVAEIAARMRLKEGEDAVRRVLREVHRREKVGTKDLARATRLPIPVAAAIRRELEKEGIMARKGGAVLTDAGRKLIEALGMAGEARQPPPIQDRRIPITDEHTPILEKLREYSKLRPRPDTRLDQAYATPETALRRALYMLDMGCLAGRDVLFLGDDDLTSVAAGLLKVARRIMAVDLDKRLLDVIKEISDEEGLGIECVRHDLRDPLPRELAGCFDTFLTDPPYTLPGLRLFLSRGIQALRRGKKRSAYLAFADKPPLEMLEIHRAVVEMGLYVDELIPRFNEYEGAELLANTTFMATLTVTEKAKPSIAGRFSGRMYTGEVRPTVRIYRCRCGERIRVGAREAYNTVEELKFRGCPRCSGKDGFKLLKKTRLDV